MAGAARGDSRGPETFFDATLDLATSFSSGEAEELYEMIRGDNPFNNVRLRLFADIVVTSRLTVLNQILLDSSADFDIGFLRSYLRYQVFASAKADLQLQAGKIPTVFGTFSERSHSDRNPFMGAPLMYHYFSSLRADQLPADNADLLRHRGRGQAKDFTGFAGGGSPQYRNGLPMVYDACWDTGVGVLGSAGAVEFLVALTQGTVSAPRAKGGDSNGGKQVAVHLGYVPAPSFRLGASYARGPYLSDAVETVLQEQGLEVEDFDQEIFGVDLEYATGHLSLIAEYAANRWETPNITAFGRPTDLENQGWYVEAKYAFRPGLYGAARYGELTFDEIDDGSRSGTQTPWDADVERLELGLGYRFNDWLLAKLVWQNDRRAAPAKLEERFLGLQLTTFF